MPSRGQLRDYSLPYNRQLFDSPHAAGRKITAGFTYLQRIGKAASYDVWFPEELQRKLEKRRAEGQAIGSEQFPAQWAAVRQFELLHESGNIKIYDLDPDHLKRSMLDLARSMRAGGYRVTVATMGSYSETATGDELEILDRRLQRRIAQMIHMLYLDEQSEQANIESDARLAARIWDYRNELPHVGMVLGAGELFARVCAENEDEDENRRGKGGKSGGASGGRMSTRKRKQAQRFFEILDQLPQDHIVHDTAIGLQLPELNGENEWNYIAHPEETLASFNRVLGTLFDPFNRLSLSRLHEREDATSEIKASTLHMRSYGHPLTESDTKFYRAAAHALN
jgi:hypothetical protein